MLYKYLPRAVVGTSLLSFAVAQVVPQDLSSGFSSSGVEVQASYTDQPETGFNDGTTFEKNEVTEQATFALGDSSGISPRRLYTIIMVDTTCDDARTLHFARANYKFLNTGSTALGSSSDPLQEYKAPGSFGETGDERKYSFLMYVNPRSQNITDLKLPQEGEAFDVTQFQSDNGLDDAAAGVGMVVKLGGTANCDGQATTPGSSSEQSAPESTSAPEATSEASAPSSTAAASQASSAPSEASEAPQASSSVASVTSAVASSGSTPIQTVDSPPSAGETSNVEVGSSVLVAPTGGANSTAFLTSAVAPTAPTAEASEVGTPTDSSSPAQQTANGAPALSMSTTGPLVGLMAVAAGMMMVL
ncbi:hypothetical protein EJ04DRAFT_454682 [Polyplosphaeria fusca]|uniref:Uncharacterized protein n=1 Tax=Polyplosphaeria fusca TaxID=682080 RepID=A0A9P4RCP5_9PLEO|nr:hypothetical protein EJ04DRAFT_454682 [Polyplosphaeria fusca]